MCSSWIALVVVPGARMQKSASERAAPPAWPVKTMLGISSRRHSSSAFRMLGELPEVVTARKQSLSVALPASWRANTFSKP